MEYYSHKKSLIQVERIEDDDVLITQSGNIPVRKGTLIAKDDFGNTYPINEEDFNSNYALVKKVEKPNTSRMSPFEETYAQQLMEFGSLDSNFEDEKYISKTLELSKNNLYI
jgi:hypothetical protein